MDVTQWIKNAYGNIFRQLRNVKMIHIKKKRTSCIILMSIRLQYQKFKHFISAQGNYKSSFIYLFPNMSFFESVIIFISIDLIFVICCR